MCVILLTWLTAPAGEAVPAASGNAFLQFPGGVQVDDYPTEGRDFPSDVVPEQVQPSESYPVINDYSATEDYPTAPQEYATDNFDYTEVVESATATIPPVNEYEEPLDVVEEADINVEDPFQEQVFEDHMQTESTPEESFIPTEEPFIPEAPQDLVPEGDTASLDGPVLICNHERFLCQDELDCVDLTAVCDGLQQCSDGSDEANCTNIGESQSFVTSPSPSTGFLDFTLPMHLFKNIPPWLAYWRGLRLRFMEICDFQTDSSWD